MDELVIEANLRNDSHDAGSGGGSTNKRELPKTQLETFIILPFQIAKPGHMKWKKCEFHEFLKDGGWVKLDSHEPDEISKVDLDETALKRIRYQAYNYFHPFVRSFWFDQNLVQRFRRSDVAELDVKIGQITSSFDAVCDLLHFTPDIAVLVLHLKSKNFLDLKDAQNCLDRLRRIYPPFLGDGYGGHFPDVVELLDKSGATVEKFEINQLIDLQGRAAAHEEKGGESTHTHVWARHWEKLISPIGINEESFVARQLGDDRAALASMVTVSGVADSLPLPQRIDQGNIVRLCFADGSGSDRSPYSERYLKNFEPRFCYDRFWYLDGESSEYPSRIMNCGYAFTWLGDGLDTGYFANQSNGAPVAFRHIYVPMAIIAHFQKAALLVTSRKLADLTPYAKDGQLGELSLEKFKALKHNFIAFTQTYWFDEITPQEQGVELFATWRRELNLQSLYDETRQEIQDVVEYADYLQSSKQSKSAHRLNLYASIFAVISLVLGYISMVGTVVSVDKGESNSILFKVVLETTPWAMLLGLAVLIIAVLKRICNKNKGNK
ncbi:MAG: hypothetical protein WC710_08150 [Gallionella sp.]|jgi:hypothetical protein